MLDLWPQLKIPIYATPFTAALLAAKRASEPGAPEIPVTIVQLGSRFKVGPFDVELVSMAHSIPESNALIIRTPAGTVLHTGDWKIDPTPILGDVTDEKKLRALGEEGCLAWSAIPPMRCATAARRRKPMSARPSPSWSKAARGRVAVTTFASNVARLRTVIDAARAADREVVVVGRAMERIMQVARETGYLRGRAGPPRGRCLWLSAAQQGGGAVHRQPGRAARGALAHRRGPASGRHAVARRHRDFFRPHHSRQRKGGRPHHQRADRPGHRR